MRKSTTLIIFTLLACFSCSSPSSPQIKPIDNMGLVELQEKGNLQLIDVRTPEEVNQGMIQGALNIDFRSPDFKKKIAQLNKDQPIAVYCGAGGRSGKTSDLLLTLGFKEIYDLTGGYSQWQQEEYPIALPE